MMTVYIINWIIHFFLSPDNILWEIYIINIYEIHFYSIEDIIKKSKHCLRVFSAHIQLLRIFGSDRSSRCHSVRP